MRLTCAQRVPDPIGALREGGCRSMPSSVSGDQGLLSEGSDAVGQVLSAGHDLTEVPLITPEVSGKHRRMSRLATSNGAYLWLAADHGLTFGAVRGLDDLPSIAQKAGSNGFSGIVLNRGTTRFLAASSRLG